MTINFSALESVLGGNPTPATPVQSASPSDGGNVRSIIEDAAQRHGLGQYAPLLVSLAKVESGLNPSAQNKDSSAGGLFQFIDGTAKQYGITNKYDPEQNADAAVRMFKENLDRFGGDVRLALAAHHVGPGKARQALEDGTVGDINISTQDWLSRVLSQSGADIPATGQVKREPASRYDLSANPYAIDFDALEEALRQEKAQQASDESPIGTNLSRGWRQMTDSLKNYGNVLAGDEAAIAENLKAWEVFDKQTPQPTSTRDFFDDWKNENYFGALTNVSGLIGASTEQVANSLPSMVGSIPGMLVGGKIGAAVGPIGAFVGAMAGGAIGSAPGSVAIETGARISGMMANDGVDLADAGAVQSWLRENSGKVIEEGAKKGLTVASVDGLAGAVGGAIVMRPILSFSQAHKNVLRGMGVDLADAKAVQSAIRTPAYMSAIKPHRDALVAANTIGQNAMRGAASFAAEITGEGLGEYAGEAAATGEGNFNEAALEAVLAGGQSAVTTAAQFAGRKMTGGVSDLDQLIANTAQPPAPVVKPNSPLQNAANAAAAVTPPAPVGATPATGPEGSIAPSATDPAAERLARIQSFVEDKAFLQGIRVTPEFGKESVSELLSAYAKARNPSVDPLLREQAMADIEAFIETFNNRPNFTLGGSGQDATQAPGTAVAPVAPSAVAAPQAPTDDGMTIDGEFREPDDRLAGANPNQLPAPPVLALPTEDALQAARDADAAYEQAYQDLVKAEQLGASEAELQAYQRALIEAQQLRDQMDAQLAEADARTEAARQRESESRRREILASVISEGVPGVNPVSDVAMRFTAELQRQGYREIVPNEDELRMIQRAVDVSAARPEAPEAEPSTPDEGQVASAPVARPAPAASSPRDKIAEVRQLVDDGWKPGQGRTLVSPTGKKRNINAIELAAAREAYRRKTATQGGADAVQPVQPNAAAQSETEAVPPAVGAAVSQEVTDAAPAQQVAEEAQAEGGQEGEASEQEVAQPEIRSPIDAAAHEAATSPLNDKPEPTDGQKSAGNYAKGHIRLHGMDITIENPKSSVRSGTSPDGTAWQNVMAHHYGDIRGSKGADGDAIDVFITDDAESATVAWVIDQKNSDGSFDEHKAVIGAATEADAREAYLANYDEGWDGLGAITSMPMEAFRAWALDGKRKRKPLAYVAPDQEPVKNETRVDTGVQADTVDSAASESRNQAAPENDNQSDLNVQSFMHTKTKKPQYVVQLPVRVEREAYQEINRRALGWKGRWSSYDKDGAVPGFLFQEEAMAQGFAADRRVRELVGLGSAPQQDAAKPAAPSYDDSVETSTQGENNGSNADDRGDESALAPVPPRELQDTESRGPTGPRSRGVRESDADGNGSPAEDLRDVGERGVAGEPGTVLPEGPDRRVEEVRIAGKDQPLEAVAESVKNDPPASEPKPKHPPRFGDNPGNYAITEADAIGTGTPGERIRANMAAVRLVLDLERENRYPTREEQAVLAKYVGWGGLKNVFKGDNSTSKQEREAYAELKRILTPDQLFWMGQSVLNAHYTSPKVVGSMYKVLRHLGVDGGRFLEPTVGTGNFIGLMPPDMAAGAKWFASEIDPITSLIAKHLYPEAQILPATGFQDAEFAYGRMDVAIGNPPFGDERITDTNKKRAEINGFKIHNYVIAKSAMHLRPGGIMAFVVTSRFLDTANPEAREYLAKNFRLVGAIRLPNNAFAENAGTEVTTDIVFLQRMRGEQRDGVTADDMAWLDTKGRILNADGETVTLNRYFAENPGMLLGKPSMQGTMYGSRAEKGEFTLEPIPGLDFAQEIDRILADEWAPLKGIGRARAGDKDVAAAAVEINREDVPVGGYFRDGDRIVQRIDDDADGNVQFRELTPETPWTEKQTLGTTRLGRIKGILALRDAAYDLMADERADAPAEQIEAKRAELNRLYDAFVDEYGFLNDNANKALMESDPRIEFGLESGYTKPITAAAAKRLGQKPAPASADKSSLLRERVFYPKQEIDSADSPADGYAISLSERGRLDLDYISELTGLSVEKVIEDLSTGDAPLIFKDPVLGRWVQEDEYLSGNVKDKLKMARGAGLEQNIRALMAVQPADVPASEIHAEFGATWIKPSVYEDFLKLLGYQSARVAVLPRSGAVETINVGDVGASLFRADIENPDYTIAEVFSAAANRRQLVAYDGRGEDRTVNPERTENLGRIRNKLIAIWNDWIKADPERAALLERDYNEIMNTTVERKYDGVKHLRTVGANPAVELRNSQKIGAWRMIQSSTVLLDQVVGAGKTMTVITGIMERKRLGLSQKPMVIVPNHLVGQWARDWLQLYPGANILAATEKDFAAGNRRRLFARIATGKFDAVIVGHSSFGFIPVSREAEMTFIRGEVEHLNAALVEAEVAEGGKKGKGDSRRVRAIKNRIAKRMEKIRELQDKPRDNVVTFEDMGIDYLAADELHEFKNLEYATTLTNVAGMGSPEGSKKAFDLYMKMRLLQEAGGGVAGATGTPISNSMVEMYSLLRYLNPGALAARNMEQFDAWVKAFASIEPRDEYTAAGKIKQRTVLASFNNLPELLQMYKQVADTVTMTDLKRIYADQMRAENAARGTRKREEFPVPKVAGGGRRLDIGEPTAEQIEFMDYLIARADILDKKKGKEKQEYAKIDNALWLMNDARKMSLDVRIIDPSAPDNPGNKVNRAADNIRSIYDKWDADRGTQLVFCDLSTPAKNATKEASKFIDSAMKTLGFESDASIKAAIAQRSYADKWAFIEARAELMLESGALDDARRERVESFLEKVSDDNRSSLLVADTGFSVYDALKAGLVERGIPEREIAFIHDASTSDQKRELFDLVNAGKVRVLIGSSAKMGAGTNVQKRIVALHHMDAPWRPSDIEQREGRAIRQGNMLYERNPEGFELEIIAYSTERTFDAQMWGVLARKAAFLEQFRSGLRSIKEEGGDAASYAEFMAEATGDQIFRDKLRLERELADIEAEDRSAKMKRSGAEQLIATADEKLTRAESALVVAKRLASADLSSVTLDGKTYRNDLAEIIEDEMARYREEYAAFQDQEEAYKIARKAWEDAAGTERGRAPSKPKAPEVPDTYSERVEARSQWAQMINVITRKMEMLPVGGDATYELKAANGVVVELLAERRGDSSDRTLFIAGEWAGDGAARGPSMAMRLMPHRIAGELRERPERAERKLRDLKTNVDQAKATLERIKPIDPQAIADVRARYEAVKKAVDEASARMAEERSQRSNRFIAKDSRRFGGGGAPASEVSRKASIPESARFRNDGTKVILAEGAKDVPFEGLEGYTFFAMKDGAKKTWLVVESTTGLSVGNGATKAEAISNAQATIGRLGLDRVKETIAAKPAITEEEKRSAYAAATEGDPRYEISDGGDPSPEEAQTVQAGIEGKNPIEAAAWLADNAPPEYATIAAKVRDKLRSLNDMGAKFGMAIVTGGDLGEVEMSGARGAVIPTKQGGDIALKVVINGADMKGRVGTSYRTVTHELVHAATMQSIQLGKRGVSQYEQATRDLFDVANAIADHINERARNAPESLSDFEISILEGRRNFLSSADEVLAWALTSPDAQSYLESIPYKRKSAWTAFVEAVRKVLGLSASSDTALSEVLRVAEVLLTPIDTAALAGFTLNKINHSDGHRYEVQQPADLPGGLSIHKSPGGLPPVAWTDGAPVVMRSSETIPETINVDGADRPTRNSSGQPIHLTEAGIRNFWRWFGDSKVVDADGRPLVVYHGTSMDKDFTKFKVTSRGAWFTSDEEVASEYAEQNDSQKDSYNPDTRRYERVNAASRVMPVYLKAENPYRLTQEDARRVNVGNYAKAQRELFAEIRAKGYDSILWNDGLNKEWVILGGPEQIKSATGNNGDFSSESGSILLRDATSNASTQGIIDRVEADAFIRGVVERYPESPEIIVARTFAQLPEAAQQGAYNQGSDEYSTKGVFHGGKVYVVMGNHTTMADLEATVFHELLGHAGVRKLFGAPFVQRLNQVFIGLGGQAGLVRIMKRRGMGDQMQRYIRGALQAQKIDADRFRQAVANGDPRARRVWTDAMMRSVLTEEVLAHIAEQIGERPGLLDRFLEMMGRIRQWLRDHGFAQLSNLGESDLLYMLSQARESLQGPGGSRVVKEGKGELFDKDGSTLTKAEKDALAVVLGALDENSPRRDQALQAMRMLGIKQEPGVTMFSIRSGSPAINKANQRTALFTALAKFDDAFQQPTPIGKTVEEIAREIDPSYRAKAMPAALAKDKTRGRAVKMWEISVPKSSARSGYLYEDARGRVWIDVSRLQPGIDAGNKIYGIAAGYAHNTGKVFIGDPEGLSPTALFRRLENMISSALRFGTTDHLYPHAAQVDPQGYFADSYPEFAPQTKGLGLDWRDGDFSHNLTEMLRVSYNASARFAPEIKEIVYDFDSRQFVDAATGDRRDRRDFARISERLRGESQTRYRGGSSTLARAALVNTLLRGEGKEAWSRVVAALGDQLRGRGLDFELREIFYQRTPDAAADGLTADQFRAALVDHFGEAGVKSLEQQGLLNIVDQNDPEVGGTLDPNNPAWYNPETGEAFFVPSFMSDARDAVEAVYHEIGAHHGLPSMLGESGWRALKSRVAMAAKGSGEIGRAWRSVIDNYPEFADLAAADYDRAAQNDRFMHEVIAKIGESAAGRKSSIWTFLQDRVRAFLRSIGLEPHISAEDVAALVQGSMKRVMTNGGNDGPRGGSRMNQMRSAPSSPSEFFASSQGRRSVRDRIGDVFSAVTSSDGVRTFNWWNRTVGSQYHKAKKSPEFRKVYELAHAYVDEISRIANTAAGQAKNILPHLDSWKDIGAGLNIRKQWADAKDYQAIASAVFDGTLANGSTGTVWTDEQLRDQFGLNDKQIGLYREFRAAVDVSLESLATSEMARAARVAKLETADPEMTMSESLAFYTDQVDAVIEKAKADIEDLSFGHEQERTMFEEEFGSMRPGATEDARKIMAARQRQEMAELETVLRDAESLRSSFTDKASQIRKLQSEGYAPLMRFGQYTVDVVRLDEDGNPAMNEDGEPDRPFFGMFETEAEAREAERVLREEYPDYTVTRGIMSTKANEMFKGVTPETAEMFARLLGTDQDGAFQAYLKQAVANRSAMKRLIERKGMAGFAQDVPRVLAAFVTSNARLSAGNWHFGEMNKAVQDIPREMGDVKDEAIKLVDYIQNPQEEAAGLRGFLFFSFLGGSVAAALVNTTQTLSTTLPYLHQFSPKGSAAAITRAMGVAYKAMRKGLDVVKDDDMRAALKRAADEGVVDPQEIHLLMAESGGNGASSFVGSVAGMVRGDLATPASRVSRAATQAWGSLFGMAEKYNRHVAFMAAWEVAGNMSEAQIKATGAKDRYDFAKRAVTETQFEYRKISRPNWARGAIGATLFTFKTFLVNYLEFVARLPARERALAIAVLLLMAGMSGAPGLEDMEDLIDTIGQKFGYNWNSAASRHAWMMKTLGEGGANFVEHGISSFLPIDVSARLGVGNIIPASDILKKSNDQKWRSAAELLGPIGSVIEGATKVFDGVGTNKAFGELIRPVAPKAYNDIYQAIDILQTGYYRDSRGRKVVEADALDAFMKSIGFQPNAVAEPRRVEWMIGQSVRMQRVIRSDIYELWSRGVFESDAEKVALAKAMLMDWNRKNPETPIKANPKSIAQRVKAMRSTSAERTVKATPKEMRGMISDQLAITE